jgi:hypothetical protein
MLYPIELWAHGHPTCVRLSGRDREIRTPDILLPKQARYQTALYPETSSSCESNRRLVEEERIIPTVPNPVNTFLILFNKNNDLGYPNRIFERNLKQ